MCEIERECQSLWDTLEKNPEKVRGEFSKVKYGNTTILVTRLFEKRLSERELRQLAASSEMIPILPDDRSRFVNDLLPFMVKAFVELGDRENLIELLSRRCPSRIDWPENLEYYLAFRAKKLKDPILVLGEAYSKCHVPETSHILVAAIRRGFAGFEIPGDNDADYVKNATSWYQKEKGHLVVNEKYPRNESVGPSKFTIEMYEKHPEFYDNPPEAREPLFMER